MKIFFKKEAEYIIRGASVLSCGGGLSFNEQIHYLEKLPIKNGIQLINVNELPPLGSDIVYVTASEIGPSDEPPIEKTKILEMIGIFNHTFNKKISGLLPVEIGQETIVFDAALQSGLPIVNTDLAGMRAVPKVNLNAFNAQGIKFVRSPFVVLTNIGEIIIIKKNNNLEVDELILRSISKKTQGVIFAMGSFTTASMIQKYLNFSSFTTALKLGKNLSKGIPLEDSSPLPILFHTKAVVKSLKIIKNSGFSEKRIELLSPQKNELILNVRNEFIKLNDGKNIFFEFPQMIALIEKGLKRGLSSGELKEGLEVNIYVLEPLRFWVKNINNLKV